jgi:hypothetical protein
LLRDLKEQGAPLRRVIEGLKNNLFPEDALKVDGYANRYEIFVSGYWIIYEVDQSGGETIILVTAIEEN